MAITRDALLGSAVTGGSITTSSAAAANSRVIVCVSWFSTSASMTAVCGGTSSSTPDVQINNGSDRYAIFSFVKAGGMASGVTITATGGGGGGLLMTAASYLGISAFDTSATHAGTTPAWTTGAVANTVADSLFIGGAGNETSNTATTSTPSNGTELFDLWDGGQDQGMVMQELIVSAIASQALTGTFAGGTITSTTGAVGVYKGIAAAGPAFMPGRMPLGC